MKFKRRFTAGIVVAALTVSAGALSAGAASANVVWDRSCGAVPAVQEAQIHSFAPYGVTYCYYGTGEGYSNVNYVDSLWSGTFNAAFNTDIGTQYFSPYSGQKYDYISTGNFSLSA